MQPIFTYNPLQLDRLFVHKYAKMTSVQLYDKVNI